MAVFAHVAGIPVEETAAMVAPVAALLAGALGMHLRRLRARASRRRPR